MSFDENIKKLNIILPDAKPPVGNYVATKITGNLLYISGQVSINSDGELIKGKVGKDLRQDLGRIAWPREKATASERYPEPPDHFDDSWPGHVLNFLPRSPLSRDYPYCANLRRGRKIGYSRAEA